ncbi:MAG: ABC transporter permease [Acidobacteriia bacterium]|nr:ABC transporter permease [Terriglobia bacterium]
MTNILLQDLRYGIRMLLKSPGFTAIAVLTLGLGIGANSAVFNVLDNVLFRSLPVTAPQELVLLTDPDAHGRDYGEESGDRSLLTYAEFEFLRDHNDVFSGIFAADSEPTPLQVSFGSSQSGYAPVESAHVLLVSGGYFSTLGVKAAAGRLFTSEVDRVPGASAMAVIGYPFWRERFGLDPTILGKSIRIHQTSFEIIGIAAPGFFGETVGRVPDMWVPLTMQQAIYPGRDLLASVPGLQNQYIWLQAMARLKPGVTLQNAKAAINLAFHQFLQSSLGPGGTPRDRQDYLEQRINLQGGSRGTSTLQAVYGNPLKLLMALVALVLLIACANVGNLLLARGTTRRREFAVRTAIGAGRFRLLQQLLTESLLLALMGACVGLLIAQWADSLLLRLVSAAVTGPESIQLHLRPDVRVLGFTLVVAVLTTLLVGLVPALRSSQFDVLEALKSSSMGPTGESAHHRLSTGKILVVAQVAISLILLVAAGLFVHSLMKLMEVNLGYNREKVLEFMVDDAPAGYTGQANLRLHQELLDKFSGIPGVQAATLSSDGLFQGSDSGDPIEVEGYTAQPGLHPHSRMDHVGPGYFSTLGIRLLIGREIGVHDSAPGPRAAVINQAFAHTYFANRNPIGKHVRDIFPGNPGEAEIVGVVADSRINSLREQIQPRIYFPFFNPVWEHSMAAYEIRTFADPAAVAGSLRRAVGETNSALLPIDIQTLSGRVDRSLGTDRLIMWLASVFGLLAMLLASIGLYGIMGYTVARRTRDIGLRLALGAQPGNIIFDVVRETLQLVLLGIALGLPVALGGTRLIRSLLFGFGGVDGIVLSLATILLAIVAALAAFLPARRASRVDPMVALRDE